MYNQHNCTCLQVAVEVVLFTELVLGQPSQLRLEINFPSTTVIYSSSQDKTRKWEAQTVFFLE